MLAQRNKSDFCPKCDSALIDPIRINNFCENCIRIPWACERCDRVFKGYYFTFNNICWDCDRDEQENDGKRCFICEKFSSTDLCWDCDNQNNILRENQQPYKINNILNQQPYKINNNFKIFQPIEKKFYKFEVKCGDEDWHLKNHLDHNSISHTSDGNIIVFKADDNIRKWLETRAYEFEFSDMGEKTLVSFEKKETFWKIVVPIGKLTTYEINTIIEECEERKLDFIEEKHLIEIYSTDLDMADWIKRSNIYCSYFPTTESATVENLKTYRNKNILKTPKNKSILKTPKIKINTKLLTRGTIEKIENLLFNKKIPFISVNETITFESESFEVRDWLQMNNIDYIICFK